MNREEITKQIKTPNDNWAKLKEDFPQCFDKNGNFDFEKFRNELRKSEINFSKESYGMDWLGKSYARLLATDEATTLLKENEEWNGKTENRNSQNLLIKGDNLEVLKHLSNAYYEKIKMIYIDPPYNTGSDGFVYEDNRKFTVEELSKLAGIDEERAKRILDFVDSKSNSHSAWLTFIYPRLYIARQLLKEDGVIFVSIDDNEVAQLRLLMDEIFGEENFVGTFKWNKTSTPPSLSKKIRQKYEFVICYEKNNDGKIFNGGNTDGGDMPLLNEGNNIRILNFPNDKIFFKFDGIYKAGKYDRVELLSDIEIINGVANVNSIVLKGPFKWKQENLNNEISNGTTFVIKTDKFAIRYERVGERIKKPADIISKTECGVGTNEDANKEIIELFETKNLFNYPKPTSLIKYLSKFITKNNDIVLDFFAGSGTTGDAVMQLNAEDGGNRKYILVQLPEPIDPKKNKTAYDFVKNELGVENPTVFEITKERLIRAAKKIKEENKDTDLSNIDFGFKIFETIPNDEGVWENYLFKAEKFDSQQKLFDESKLTDKDIKTLLTTWKTFDGIPLTENLKKINLDGYEGYYYGTKLYLTNKNFNTNNLKKLLEEIDENADFNPATIIAFGYNFESKMLREIAENVKNYANKKQIDIDFIERY